MELSMPQMLRRHLVGQIALPTLSTCSAIIHKPGHNEEINIQVISAVYGKSSMEKNHTEGIMKRSNKRTRRKLVEKTGYV